MLSYRFWREFAEIPNVWAIKIAPFNRYQTIDVVRAVVEAGRNDIALYTGNDDNIVADLLTPFPVSVGGTTVLRWIDGGLLGQWAVWTRGAVALLAAIKDARASGEYGPTLLSHGAALTDANARGVRCRQRVRRLHSGNSRGAAPPGIARRRLVSRSRRGVVARSGGRDHACGAELSGGD